MLQRTYSRVHSSHCIEGHRSTSIIDGVEAVWAISIHVKDSVDVLTFFPVDTDRRTYIDVSIQSVLGLVEVSSQPGSTYNEKEEETHDNTQKNIIQVDFKKLNFKTRFLFLLMKNNPMIAIMLKIHT
uniref:Uncharacterized protein n=1 Tax=Cacopsylla melanoneura TaxID=428564 RepID=A0A8D8REI6_9HEMI